MGACSFISSDVYNVIQGTGSQSYKCKCDMIVVILYMVMIQPNPRHLCSSRDGNYVQKNPAFPTWWKYGKDPPIHHYVCLSLNMPDKRTSENRQNICLFLKYFLVLSYLYLSHTGDQSVISIPT